MLEETTSPSDTSDHDMCGWPVRNVTIVYYNPDVLLADKILRPLWMVLCTTNVLNILLLRKVPTYQAVFLVALASFDLTTMWAWFSLYMEDHILWGYELPSTAVSILAVVGTTAAQCSDWTLLTFSLARLISIKFPIESRRWFDQYRAKVDIAIVVVLAIVTWMFEFIHIVSKSVSKEKWYTEWQNVQRIGTIFSELFTFSAIFLANVLVICFLKIHASKQTHLTADSDSGNQRHKPLLDKHSSAGNGSHTRSRSVRTRARQTHSDATVRMLTAYTGVYILTKSPIFFYQIVEKLCVARFPDQEYAIFVGVYNQLMYASYSLQFILYCAVSPVFLKRAIRAVTSCNFDRESPQRTLTLTTSLGSQRSKPDVSLQSSKRSDI